MKVVLLEDIKNLGKRNAVVEVSDGHARNFLIPRKLAVPASEAAVKSIEQMKREGERRESRRKEEARAAEGRIGQVTVNIKARAGENGRLFGSVTAQQIASELKRQHGIEIDKRQITLHDSIRVVGTHSVPVYLHSDVKTALRVEVVGD